MKLTVFYEEPFWVGVIEFVEGENHLKAGRFVFGNEPKDEEILDFVHNHLADFIQKLTQSVALEGSYKRKVNPKRLARQVSKEMKTKGVSTYAQQAIQMEYEKRKQEKKRIYREKKEKKKKLKREIKKKKAKEKHRGH